MDMMLFLNLFNNIHFFYFFIFFNFFILFILLPHHPHPHPLLIILMIHNHCQYLLINNMFLNIKFKFLYFHHSNPTLINYINLFKFQFIFIFINLF